MEYGEKKNRTKTKQDLEIPQSCTGCPKKFRNWDFPQARCAWFVNLKILSYNKECNCLQSSYHLIPTKTLVGWAGVGRNYPSVTFSDS